MRLGFIISILPSFLSACASQSEPTSEPVVNGGKADGPSSSINTRTVHGTMGACSVTCTLTSAVWASTGGDGGQPCSPAGVTPPAIPDLHFDDFYHLRWSGDNDLLNLSVETTVCNSNGNPDELRYSVEFDGDGFGRTYNSVGGYSLASGLLNGARTQRGEMDVTLGELPAPHNAPEGCHYFATFEVQCDLEK